MNNEFYWLWYSLIKGIKRQKLDNLLEKYINPRVIFEMKKEELAFNKELNYKDIDLILNSRNSQKIQRYVEKLIDFNIRFCSIESVDYPSLLKQIYDPPYVINYKGILPDKSENTLAIVGSRKCSENGRSIAHKFAKELSENQVVAVSGLARGIDTAAHKGAIDGEGKTIAVLGCGLDICYPRENQEIFNEITKKGAVISEYAMGTQPLPYHFPMRNRIISGLSKGVLVIEAAKKSGSLITADQALEQGRDVYAIPGDILKAEKEGTNNLIKQGAKIVTNTVDILEEILGYGLFENQTKVTNKQQILKVKLANTDKMIYDCLDLNPKNADEICREVKMPVKQVQHILLMLELEELIVQIPNKRYIIKV